MAKIEIGKNGAVVLSGGQKDMVIERRKKGKGLKVSRNFAELPDGRVSLGSILDEGQKDEEGYQDKMGIA